VSIYGEYPNPAKQEMNIEYLMKDHGCVCAQAVNNVLSEKIHIMLNDNPNEFYGRLGRFIISR
jgi:hypothetical protein